MTLLKNQSTARGTLNINAIKKDFKISSIKFWSYDLISAKKTFSWKFYDGFEFENNKHQNWMSPKIKIKIKIIIIIVIKT